MNDIVSIIKDLVIILKHFITGKRAKLQLEKVKNIYEEMTKIVEETGVERFLVLKAENGGGTVKPGVHLYASVIYEMYRHPIRSNIRNYQRVLIDADYLKALVEAINNGYINIDVSNLSQDSILGQIYSAEGIKYSRLYFLGATKKAVYYCSIATTDPSETFTDPVDRLAITLAIGKIKALLK